MPANRMRGDESLSPTLLATWMGVNCVTSQWSGRSNGKEERASAVTKPMEGERVRGPTWGADQSDAGPPAAGSRGGEGGREGYKRGYLGNAAT